MSHDPHSHQFLAVIAPIHHERIRQTLDNGALSLSKSLHRIAAGRVGDVHWRPYLDVVTVVLTDGSALRLKR